jgi:hypothetical protein
MEDLLPRPHEYLFVFATRSSVAELRSRPTVSLNGARLATYRRLLGRAKAS